MKDSSDQKIADPAEMIKYLQGQNRGLITRNGELATELKKFKRGEWSIFLKFLIGTTLLLGAAAIVFSYGGLC